MTVALADDPPQLVRIGRRPDPLAWPPLAFTGIGRFDDPDLTVSTLYASVERRTAFFETLDSFRPNLSLLAHLDEDPEEFGWRSSQRTALSDPFSGVRGVIPEPFFDRLIAEFQVVPGQRWLDLRTPKSSEALRAPLANRLLEVGYTSRFVHGDLLGNDHRVTQVFASWAIENTFAGIAYGSCHDPSRTCWALFDHARIASVDSLAPVSRNDPDVREVAKQWNLDLSWSGLILLGTKRRQTETVRDPDPGIYARGHTIWPITADGGRVGRRDRRSANNPSQSQRFVRFSLEFR